jgi:S1-C subfamily serine protease
VVGRMGRVFAAGVAMTGVALFASPAFAASPGVRQFAVGSGSGSALDVSSIAAAVDPSIVDINTTLDNGAAAGTGIVLGASGIVLTNNHVIEGANTISVQVDGTGPTYTADVVGYDVADDLAVLQMVGASGLTTASTADSSQVQVQDPVVALGNALGRGGTPATAEGSVTALNQTITAADESGANPETLNGMIQVDAPIQPGDSGGPLVNADGKVIGIDSAGSSSGNQLTGSSATVGFAIPIDHALDIAGQIEAGDASSNVHLGARAILGIEVQGTSGQSTSGPSTGGQSTGNGFGNGGNSSGFNRPGRGNNGPFGSPTSSGDTSGLGGQTSAGVQISGVASGGPAESAGLAAGDTITAIDGQSVNATADITSAMNAHRPGDHVSLEWTDSSGTQHTATVTLVAGPPA